MVHQDQGTGAGTTSRWAAALLLFGALAGSAPAAGGAQPTRTQPQPQPPASAAPALAPADARSPSAKLFGKRCGACHTIGEGSRVGPDLLGVDKRRERPWLLKFIRNPGSVIDAGDPVAQGLLAKFKGVRMPDQDLTSDQLEGILSYLADCTTKGGCKLALGDVRHASQATPGDIATGRRIFQGLQPLSKGGAACISCHNVRGIGILGGGTLAMDLTHAYARLGDKGLGAALDNTPFPFMRDIYAKRPLTEAEAFEVKAFLASVSKSGERSRPDFNFFYLGVLGMLLALGIIGFLWRGRMRGVRSTIVKRGEP